MSGTKAVIEVQDLRKRYGANGPEAVKGVSCSVSHGEVFGLLGPNGAGKTTTIGVLTTRLRPTAGSAVKGLRTGLPRIPFEVASESAHGA